MAFELFALTGKRALITGSSQGIGFALAQGLAEHGAEIVLNGRDAAKLDAAAARLAAAGHKVSVAGFDVTQAQAAKDGVAAIEKNSRLAMLVGIDGRSNFGAIRYPDDEASGGVCSVIEADRIFAFA